MREVVADARSQPRVLTVLFSILGLQTLLLSALGIFAVVSVAVTRRTREIGVRLALGGAKPGILRMLLGSGIGLGSVGAILGLTAAVGLSRFLSPVLFEVDPLDPWVFGGAAVFAMTTVTLASLFPALTALRVDPVQTIKAE
jgi:ABC-type antimicrobial peptide transport system permease subunit